MENDILVIKGRFSFRTSNTYGFFAILLDLVQKSLFDNYIFVSHFSDIKQIDIKLIWLVLEEQINNILMQGIYANHMTAEYKRILYENLAGEYGLAAGLVVDYQLKNKEKIRNSLENFFITIQKDRDFSIELEFEETSKEKIMAAREERKAIETEQKELQQQQKEQKPSTPFEIAPTDQEIPASPILSPIHGILCSLLAPNMKILMKLDNTSKEGQEWIKNFHAFDEKEGILLPLIATIDQIKKVKNQYHILVRYKPNQVTQLTLEDGVKIKLYDQFLNEHAIDPVTNTVIPDPTIINPLSGIFSDKNLIQFLIWSFILIVFLLSALIFI